MSTDNAEMEVKTSTEGESKPNIVDWDSPTDPEIPLMWTNQKKMVHVLLISGFTLYSYEFLSQNVWHPLIIGTEIWLQ
jgi:hypothetical protein